MMQFLNFLTIYLSLLCNIFVKAYSVKYPKALFYCIIMLITVNGGDLYG